MVNVPKKKKKKYQLKRREPVNKEHLTQLVEKIQSKNLKIIKRQNRNYIKQRASSSRKRRKSNSGEESESDQIVKKCYEEWLKEEMMRSTSPKLEVDEDDEEAEENNKNWTRDECDTNASPKLEVDEDNEEAEESYENWKRDERDTNTSQELEIDEDNKEAEESYKNWRRNEYDTYNAIDRKTLLSKIDMFEKMLKPTKKVDCGLTSLTSDDIKIMWTSPTYIARYIRKCILKHEWMELAHLLLLLTKHSHLYESYTRELAFLTTLMSTDKCKKDLLADLKLCFVTEKAQEAKEFDVWYLEKSAKDTVN